MDVFKLKGSVELDIKDVVSGLDKVDQKVKSTDKSINKISDSSKKTSDAMSKMKKMGQNAMGTIDKWAKRGAIAVGALASGILAMGIKGNASLETSITSWSTLLGTQEQAKTMMDDITKYAARTPFSKMGVDEMAKQLHNAGFEGQAMFDQMTKFGNMGSAFAVQEDSLKEMVRQYSQVQMAGTAYTEDLNILQDRGIPIYKALSETLGIAVGDVKKMASEGALTADIYNQALDSIANGTVGAMEAQSKTFSGMLSTIKDNVANISQKVIKPIFEKIIEYMPLIMQLTDEFSANIDSGKGIMEGMKDAIISVFGEDTYNKIMGVIGVVKNLTIAYLILKGVMAIATIINTLSTAYTALSGAMTALKGSTVAQTIAQWAMNSAWLASPITWIIAGIVAVIAIFVLLWNKCEGFRNFWIELWEIIKTAFGAAKDWIGEKVTSLVDGAKNKFEELKDGIMKPINWAKSKLKDAIETMKGFFKFDWSLPKIKLPHFNISGKFSLNPPSIPKFNVDWYSKGAIFTQPTVLGNIGVGDADNGKGSKAEAILPIDDLRDMIKDLLQVTIPLYIDSREFAKATAKPMKDEIDALQMRDVRLRY